MSKMALARREKWILVGVACLLAAFAAFQIAAKPAIERLETLRRIVPEMEASLRTLRLKSQEYAALQSELARLRETITKRDKDFAILSFLERLRKECGLAQNVEYRKPPPIRISDGYLETRVEIELTGVSLQQIANFLMKAESSEALLAVPSLRIRKSARTPTLLDVKLEVTTVAPAVGG